MTNVQTSKERLESTRRRNKIRSRLIVGGLGFLVISIIGFVVWITIRPPIGEGFPIMLPNHIADNIDPGEYNSDPPTSGPHYAEGLPGGFYDETDLAQLPVYPDGHLVHNLEHGYILFWYNCNVISEIECINLKTQMIDYMDESSNSKLIAFPRESIDHPLVLSSWGYLLELHEFDEAVVGKFIRRNRNHAPEPNAP